MECFWNSSHLQPTHPPWHYTCSLTPSCCFHPSLSVLPFPFQWSRNTTSASLTAAPQLSNLFDPLHPQGDNLLLHLMCGELQQQLHNQSLLVSLIHTLPILLRTTLNQSTLRVSLFCTLHKAVYHTMHQFPSLCPALPTHLPLCSSVLFFLLPKCI